MTPPIDQSVLDLLRQSAAGPALDRPVNDVLRDMGLPALPELSGLPPLPEMPPLPVIDLSLLAKPLTDLAAGFGTGQLPFASGVGAPDTDPAQVLSQVSTVVQTAMTVGSSALQVAMMLWQGMGASAAADKAGQAAADGAAVSAQSAQTSLGVTAAAGSVFQGATLMAAIIAKFMASVTAAAPFLTTGAGQVFLMAMTTETMAEALAVVAKTRGELTVHSGAMTATGTKIPVTGAPKNVDPSQTISQLMQLVQPLTQLATTGGQALQAAQTALNPPKSTVDRDREPGGARLEGGGAVPAGAVGGMAAGAGGPARQLASWSGARPGGSLGPAGMSVPGAEPAASTPASAVRGASSGPSVMPMGGNAAAAAARSGEQSADGLRGLLVTEQHGNEVVGDLEGASLPVVGAAEQVSQRLDSDSPDKSLIL
ncbi:hypothetical protein [Nocardia grenadensis]|uniref:hypothetical protein n=1 Tax=Nocardia grenadensis TaxID=931537 RepID=UPI003D75FB23